MADPLEYDVYIAYREGPGRELADLLSEGLTRRGFRVFPGGAQLPDDIPDFVLVLTPGALEDSGDEHDVLRAKIAHAIETERNIVPVLARGYEHPETLPPDIVRLRTRHPVRFDPTRRDESIAKVAHRLSSDASVDERHMMRDARHIGIAVGLLALILLTIAAIRTLPGMVINYLASRPLPPMAVYWSAFGERPAGNGWVEIPIKDGTSIAAGDQLRVAFSPSADGYAYVVFKDARGQITVLFPGKLLKDGSRVRAGRIYTAPLDGGWWAPEEGQGSDGLYLFASYDSIENLESLNDNREESSAERQALLDSTIEGLLDGKHGTTPARIRTRAGRRVYRNIDLRPPVLTASALLGSGMSVTHTLSPEVGLLSAMVELRIGAVAK